MISSYSALNDDEICQEFEWGGFQVLAPGPGGRSARPWNAAISL